MYLEKIPGVTGKRSSHGQLGETNETEAKSFYSYTYEMCILNNYKLKN